MATPVPQMLAKTVPKKPTTTSGVIPKANIPTAPSSLPTDQSAHQSWINNSSSGQGGMDSYIKRQNDRWQAANQSNDTDLMNRLTADSQRVGYTLNPYNAPKQQNVDPNQQRFQQYQQQQDEIMNQLKSFMQPMRYDPNRDAQAKAYKQYYDNLASQASQSAMEALNERGILNSSMTAGEVAAAQQNANLQYGTKLAELDNQFYQRQQDGFNNATRLLGMLGDMQQRSTDNAYRDRAYDRNVLENDRAFNRGVEENDRAYNRQTQRDAVADNQWQQSFEYQKMTNQEKMDYQRARDQIEDERYKQKFDEDVRRYGLDTAREEAYRNRQLSLQASNAAADNARANRSLDLQERRFAFDQEQASGQANRKQMSQASYSEFLQDLPRIDSIEEGNQLINLYRQQGVDESTLANMQKAINSRFKE